MNGRTAGRALVMAMLAIIVISTGTMPSVTPYGAHRRMIPRQRILNAVQE